MASLFLGRRIHCASQAVRDQPPRPRHHRSNLPKVFFRNLGETWCDIGFGLAPPSEDESLLLLLSSWFVGRPPIFLPEEAGSWTTAFPLVNKGANSKHPKRRIAAQLPDRRRRSSFISVACLQTDEFGGERERRREGGKAAKKRLKMSTNHLAIEDATM